MTEAESLVAFNNRKQRRDRLNNRNSNDTNSFLVASNASNTHIVNSGAVSGTSSSSMVHFPPPSSTSSTVHFLPPSSTSMIPTSAIYSSASNHHMGNVQQSVIPTYLNPGYLPPSSYDPGSIPGSANTSLININQGNSSHINPASYYRIPHSISLCLRVYQSVSINHHLQAMLHDPCDNPPTSQLPFMLLRSSTLGALRTNSVNFTRSSTAPKLN